MTGATLFDDRACSLGEGPLWHPLREQLFWFDINAHCLHSRSETGAQTWQFPDFVSAAGWIDRDRLLIAAQGALIAFDLQSGTSEAICPLDPENPVVRPNDGRADPYGGFWIGTMGKNKETDAGAIYRYYRGEMRRLFAPWSIPNAICFTPDGGHAYLADTPRQTIWKQALDAQGWPKGDPEPFLHLPASAYRPDGAVVDAGGNLWCAHYGHAKVTVHSPRGEELRAFALPAARTTCPAFGGADLSRLFVTSARQELDDPAPADGCTYVIETDARGQAEHQVIL